MVNPVLQADMQHGRREAAIEKARQEARANNNTLAPVPEVAEGPSQQV